MNVYKIGVLMVLLVSTQQAAAQQSESLLNFEFNHLLNTQIDEQVSQYDATWTYPLETKTMIIDLGVTLRHLSGFKSSPSSDSQSDKYFHETFPLVHASALFALPLKGLSAGIEGSHIDSSDTQVFDYRAKVSYEWRSGFGLHGGWQHQQLNLETKSTSVTDYQRNGPFIDFYLNF